jgi:cyclophilin family peptidyl-prolyl cis-trans isomerase
VNRSRATLLALALVALLALLAGCGDDKDGSKPAAAATTEQPQGPCEVAEAPGPKATTNLKKPKLRLDPSKTWTAIVTTNCGEFTITLDVERAPKTAASFASLAKKGFYDDLTFHRIAPEFVLQGGDPLGNGTGGPGYKVVEAPPKDLVYMHGSVAMAKTATERDGTSGSQFFVMLSDDTGLPPQYALVGQVTEGLDVIDQIATVELESTDPQGSAPLDPVVIESVEVAGS